MQILNIQVINSADINTLRPRQKGRHFPYDIFKCIFLNENIWNSINFSLKFVTSVPVNIILALVQIMAWCRPGNRQLWKVGINALQGSTTLALPKSFIGHFILCRRVNEIFICSRRNLEVKLPNQGLYSLKLSGRLTGRSRVVSKPRDPGSDFSVALKFGRHLGSSAAEMPVKFQSDMTIITSNLAASRLHDIWR